MGTFEKAHWTVVHDKVAIRSAPSIDSVPLLYLEHGDAFEVEGSIDINGESWLTLSKGSVVAKDLQHKGYVLTVHSKYGALVEPVKVVEEKKEGILTRSEMQEILSRANFAKDLLIPLEAKTWSKHEFEIFVMSSGTIRPKWCSIGDTNELVNNNMGSDEVEFALRQAAEWIRGADAILVGSGAGMGVDSGLSTFRGGKAGVWPSLDKVGLAYEEICDPKWFQKDPELAWAFWNFCHETYRETLPHKGYEMVREWAARVPLGAFNFTSNIDSHWETSGWHPLCVIEIHGAVRWHQCAFSCCPNVWVAPKQGLGLHENPTTYRAVGSLPKCATCGKVARPNVQMFGGDSGFGKGRRNTQLNRYDGWLKRLQARPDSGKIRMVCLELGCGLTVPTVRKELERVVRLFPNAHYVRVNPENPGLAKDLQDRGVSLPLGASEALNQLGPMIGPGAVASASFVLWDLHGNGVEFAAPADTTCDRLLRLAELEDDVQVEFDGSEEVQFYLNQGPTNRLAPATKQLHPSAFFSLKDSSIPSPPGSQYSSPLGSPLTSTMSPPPGSSKLLRVKQRNAGWNQGMQATSPAPSPPQSPRLGCRETSAPRAPQDGISLPTRSPSAVPGRQNDAGPEDDGARSTTLGEDRPAATGAELDEERWPAQITALVCTNVRFTHGMSRRLQQRYNQVEALLDEFIEEFGDPHYQDEVRKQKDQRGVKKITKNVQLRVLPHHNLRADDKGIYVMSLLIGLITFGRREIGEKAGKSMQLSFLFEAAQTLPAVHKEEVQSRKEDKPLKQPQKEEKPEEPKPLQVTLTQMGSESPETLQLEAMTDTTIAELRVKLGARLALEPRTLREVRLCAKSGNTFFSLKDADLARANIFVQGICALKAPVAPSSEAQVAKAAQAFAPKPATTQATAVPKKAVEVAMLTIHVSLDLEFTDIAMSVSVPKGSQLSFVKDKLCEMDSTGKTGADKFRLCSLDEPDKPLRDDDVITDALTRLLIYEDEDAPPPPPEPLTISLTRLGDEPAVKYDVQLTKTSLVAELRERIAEACGLDAKAAKKLKFMGKGKGGVHLGREDTDTVVKVMCVRNLNEWPPPA